MGMFGAAHGLGNKKNPSLKSVTQYLAIIKPGTVIPYLKKIQKNIWITWYTPWVLLASALFHQKPGNFAISKNSDVDGILLHNF